MNLTSKSYIIWLVSIWLIGCIGKPSSEGLEPNSMTEAAIDTLDLIYTKHAICRMDCRNVSEIEVIEIITANRINIKKSDYKDKPCPTIAYEGRSSDGQLLRIVVADCEPRDKVVTVIDLETDFKCDCY